MRLRLRAQMAIATGLIALIVVAVAGVVIALRIDHRDRALVDEQLQARAERVVTDIDKLLADGNGTQPGDDGYGDLLDGSESLVRLLDGSDVVAQRGAIPEQPLALPDRDGFTQVEIDGTAWRSFVLASGNGIRLQVLQSLEPVNERRAANTQLLSLVTLLAAVASGAAGWFAGSRVLRPLDRLTSGAVVIAEDPDPTHRLPTVSGPAEIATLSTTLNSMLDRLGASTETTRRFAADVGHELRGPLTASTTYLDTLLMRSDLNDEVRSQIHTARAQQARMVSTLAALQVLARVDAGAVPQLSEIEPGLLTEELVRLARIRHPETTFAFTDTTAGAVVHGWSEGLRIAIDNLLDNAAVHGRPGGTVCVNVTCADSTVNIGVGDDGPGIPEELREPLRARFARGSETSADGSGLGLALVDQQADLHRGHVTLGASQAGGLLVELVIPTQFDRESEPT